MRRDHCTLFFVSNGDIGYQGNELATSYYGNNHGGLVEINGKHYILYDELSEDNEVVKNVIKIGPKSVELTRKGGQSSHMVFEEGKENLSYYDTPFGSLLMGVNTSNIDWIEEEEQMHLKVDYDLSMNSDHVSKCKIDVNIRPNGE